jgi:hypothetical protein
LDEAKRMQALQRQRIEHQNPLYQAVTQLAMSRLPGASQQALSPMLPIGPDAPPGSPVPVPRRPIPPPEPPRRPVPRA